MDLRMLDFVRKTLTSGKIAGNLVESPSMSIEIIKIYAISESKTLFFVFFSFQRLSLRVLRSVHSIIKYYVRVGKKMMTSVLDIR